MNTNEKEDSDFSIEDVVSYSNIEITHVNDNKAPMKVIANKAIVLIVIALLIAAVFFS
jgi:hypothetical protein